MSTSTGTLDHTIGAAGAATTPDELELVLRAAAEAAPIAHAATDRTRAAWLTAVADALDASADELVAVADEESHLGTTRLAGELARTTAQLRLFARVVVDGGYLEATIDHADQTATPPHGDLRRVLRPLGPVGVFSASNFPFAFSVAGGDTASALAVGCPVVVKAHSGHPRLSALTSRIVSDALDSAGAPAGFFALVSGREAGVALVQHPVITAVGFTGSLHGGRALFDLAVSRPDPIPFYGELGSINPVLVTPGAASARLDELATGLAASFTMGVGQFCTKPGVVFVPAGSGFEAALAAAVTASAGLMLTPSIRSAYDSGTDALASHPSVETLLSPSAQHGTDAAAPAIFATTVAAVLDDADTLLAEVFGPTTLLVRYDDVDEALRAIEAVGGSLTATLHAEPTDDVTRVVEVLSRIAGRVLFGGWPTGVAVTWSQQHGGPWPSTTSSLHTSVGATAVRRFQRPVTFQTAPDALLPASLQEANPLGIPRRVDGQLVLP